MVSSKQMKTESIKNYMQNLERETAVELLLATCKWRKTYQTLEIKHLKLYAEICLKSKQSLFFS